MKGVGLLATKFRAVVARPLSGVAKVGIGIAIGGALAFVRDPRPVLDLLPFYFLIATFATSVALICEWVLPRLVGWKHALASLCTGVLIAYGIGGAVLYAQDAPRFSDWFIARKLFVGPVPDTEPANNMIEVTVKDLDEPVEIHVDGGGATGYVGVGGRNDLGVDATPYTRAGVAMNVFGSASAASYFGKNLANMGVLVAAGVDSGGLIVGPIYQGPLIIGTATNDGATQEPRVYFPETYKVITDNVATAFVRVDVPSNSITGGKIDFSVWAFNATDFQARSGTTWYTVQNDSGVEVCTIGNTAGTDLISIVAVSVGTLTASFTCATTPTNGVNITVQSDTSLTPTGMGIHFSVYKNTGIGAVVPL